MNSHLIITNNKSFEIVKKTGIVGIFEEDKTKPQYLKTKSDIFSDILVLRKNDNIFFHNTDEKGIIGVFKVVELPYIDNVKDNLFEKKAPYRFIVKPEKNLYFPNYIKENQLFQDKNVTEKYKTFFYKKCLNRGKACTHILPEEKDHLIKALISVNGDKNYNLIIENPLEKPKACDYIKPILQIHPNKPQELQYEKNLESWLSYNIDKNKKCEIIVKNLDTLQTFMNYTPIHISGSNLDFLVFHFKSYKDKKIINKINLIELKKGKCDLEGFGEIEKYTRWLHNNITQNINIVHPIIIAQNYKKEIFEKCKYWNLNENKPLLIKYEIVKEQENIDLKLKKVNNE